MSDSGFDFKKLVGDTKAVLLAPAEYFASMPKEGGMAEPLIKAIIYNVIAALINFLWLGVIFTSFAGTMGGFFGGSVGIMGIILSIIGGIIALFVGGVIVLVISAICGGNTNYEANVRVTASLMALTPISAILGFTSYINMWLGLIVSVVISLYGIFLLYQALTKSLGGKEGAAKIVSGVLCLIPVLMIISTLMCYQGAKQFSNELMKGMPAKDRKQAEKMMNDMLKKAMEEAKKNQK